MYMKQIGYFVFMSVTLIWLVSCSSPLPPTPPPSVTDTEVLQVYQKAIEDDAEALRTIGMYCISGRHGFPENKEMAADALERAARLGDAKAQSLMVLFYTRGIGRRTDYSEARKYLRRLYKDGYIKEWEYNRFDTLLDYYSRPEDFWTCYGPRPRTDITSCYNWFP